MGILNWLLGVRVPKTPIYVHPKSNPKRIARRVLKYQAAKAGLYASPWRMVPRRAQSLLPGAYAAAAVPMIRLLWTLRGVRVAPNVMQHENRQGKGLPVPPGGMRVRTVASMVIPFVDGEIQVIRRSRERDEVM